MKRTAIFFVFLFSLSSSLMFAQSAELIEALEFVVLKRNVKIMEWEDEYSPDDDIVPWASQKRAAAAAWGPTAPQGKIISEASMDDYIAAANLIRSDYMKTKYNFASNLSTMAKGPVRWDLMKRAYNNACFSVIRKMYQTRVKTGHMNAAGNWLIASEMQKVSKSLYGEALTPLKDGCMCDYDSLLVLQKQAKPKKPKVAVAKNHGVASNNNTSSTTEETPVDNSHIYICDRGGSRTDYVELSMSNQSDWIVRYRFVGGYDDFTKKTAYSDWKEVNPKKSGSGSSPWPNTTLQGVQIEWKDGFTWKSFTNSTLYKTGHTWNYSVTGQVFPPKAISLN